MISSRLDKENFKREIQPLVNIGYHLPQAIFWTLFYRYPARNLTVIGVTGTDGKTTTSNLVWHILDFAGKKAGLVTSINAKIGQSQEDTGFHVTTPDPKKLQQFLWQMKTAGSQYAVLETTSHGLDQYRLWGANFYIGIITNLTHEHLDYHQTMANYARAKAKLIKKSRIAILNQDDDWFDYFASVAKSNQKKIITYAVKSHADITPKTFPHQPPLPGIYNQYNCLAAIAATKALGIDDKTIVKALKTFSSPQGRLEAVDLGQKFKVYVDFAHTPNALKNVLDELKKGLPSRGRLIAVFGAAGLRDKSKRPIMGQTASQIADQIIITNEDPRTEDPTQIAQEIVAGMNKKDNYQIILDRDQAINQAISQAQKQDTVVILGKGHEKSMCFGKKETPWSDFEAAKRAINNQLK